MAALVRLLAPLGISAPAVRTAVSRMARQGWLTPVRLPEGAGYRLSSRGVGRMTQAADRIYRQDGPAWDGRWHVVVIERITDRAKRDRLRSALGYLGYGCLDNSTWVGPHPSVELEPLLAAERIRAERFYASYDGDARGLAARVWDIDGLAHAYSRWLAGTKELVAAAGPGEPDVAVFTARSALVHEWRKFLFTDPGLPPELLPTPWPGAMAAELFHSEAARLLPAAARFVDRCLRPGDADRQPGEDRHGLDGRWLGERSERQRPLQRRRRGGHHHAEPP